MGAVEKLVDFAVQKCGGLDMAVNNAGISGTRNTTADYSLEDWHRLININLNGVFYCMKYEIAAILSGAEARSSTCLPFSVQSDCHRRPHTRQPNTGSLD